MLSDQEQEQQGWEVQVPKFNKSLWAKHTCEIELLMGAWSYEQ
jgi:hypothetical protein